MNKKVLTLIKWFAVIAISASAGLFIGMWGFDTAHVVYEQNGCITCYSIKFGQITSCSTSVKSDIESDPLNELVKIDLKGVHNNKQAIEQIRKQVSALGGRMISVSE